MIRPVTIRGVAAFEINRGAVLVDRFEFEEALRLEYMRGREAERQAHIASNQQRRMISVRQMAELMACSQQKVRLLLTSGEIESFRIDGNVRCWRDEFERWVERHTEPEVVPPPVDIHLDGPAEDVGEDPMSLELYLDGLAERLFSGAHS